MIPKKEDVIRTIKQWNEDDTRTYVEALEKLVEAAILAKQEIDPNKLEGDTLTFPIVIPYPENQNVNFSLATQRIANKCKEAGWLTVYNELPVPDREFTKIMVLFLC